MYFLLILLSLLYSTVFPVVSIDFMDAVPVPSTFIVHIGGSQWQRVQYRCARGHATLQLGRGEQANSAIFLDDTPEANITTVCHELYVAETLMDILEAALLPVNRGGHRTDASAVYFTEPVRFTPDGMTAALTVVRVQDVGTVSLTDDELLGRLRDADLTPLRQLYTSVGGQSADVVTVRRVGFAKSSEAVCDRSCLYAIGIAVPLVAIGFLTLPVYMSILTWDNRKVKEPKIFLVQEAEEEPYEFADCEDWGPVRLLPQEPREHQVAAMDGLVVVDGTTATAPPAQKEGKHKRRGFGFFGPQTKTAATLANRDASCRKKKGDGSAGKRQLSAPADISRSPSELYSLSVAYV